MSKREIENLIRLLKQQLELMTKYEDDILKYMGHKELEEKIDETLEKLKRYIAIWKKLKDQDSK